MHPVWGCPSGYIRKSGGWKFSGRHYFLEKLFMFGRKKECCVSENSLLQVISEYVGGMYISDISARWFSPEAKENIRRIPDETFTLKEWYSAVT